MTGEWKSSADRPEHFTGRLGRGLPHPGSAQWLQATPPRLLSLVFGKQLWLAWDKRGEREGAGLVCPGSVSSSSDPSPNHLGSGGLAAASESSPRAPWASGGSQYALAVLGRAEGGH